MQPTKDFPEQRVTELQATLADAWEKFFETHRYGHYVAIQRQALEELRSILGSPHAIVLKEQRTLAYMLYAWGKRSHNKEKRHQHLQESQALYTQVLSIREEIGEVQDIGFAYMEAAYPFLHDKDYANAIAMFQKAIDIGMTISSTENRLRRQLPHILGHQGGSYIDSGDYGKAVETLQHALVVLEQNTGSKVHEDSYYLYQWLSIASKKLGDQIEKTRNANHPTKLDRAKDMFSQLYLGKNGINAVSAKNRTGKIRVYADNAEALNGIPNPFEGYALELKVSPPARLAAQTKEQLTTLGVRI